MWIYLYDFLRDQGAIIAGLMALIAAYLTIQATQDAASREIGVAQEQIKVAQQQIDTTARIERRRIARESYAFYATLEAAMASISEDIGRAHARAAGSGLSGSGSPTAYEIRRSIRKPAFVELRAAFLRLGGQLTSAFLALDKEIDEFRSRCYRLPTAGEPNWMGENAGIMEGLNCIDGQAKSLRQEALTGIERCMRVLATPSPVEDLT